MSDDLDSLTKVAGGGGVVAMFAAFLGWLRLDRQRETNEAARRAADEARDARHREFLAALQAHGEVMVAGMRAQSEAQLAGIKAASEGQAVAFAQAAHQAHAALAVKIDLLAETVAETRGDLKELGREIRACAGCVAAPLMGPGLRGGGGDHGR